jgi:hypothetical protein
VKVDITAAHLGFMEWRLCPDPVRANEQSCFNEHLLKLANARLGGGSQVYVKQPGRYTALLRLPNQVKCDNCVIQWNYRAGEIN